MKYFITALKIHNYMYAQYYDHRHLKLHVLLILTSPVQTVCWSSPLSVNVPAGVVPSAAILPCIRNPRKSELAIVPDSITVKISMFI